MTSTLPAPTADELDALRELADDMFASIVEPHLHSQQVALPWSLDAWHVLAESGLTLLTTPESAGGSGAGFTEASVLLDRAGYHALPAPLAESDLLAAWLLTRIGRTPPGSPTTAVCVDLKHSRISAEKITLHDVPWGAIATNIVVVGEDFVGYLPADSTVLSPLGDLAGENYATVRFDGAALDTTVVSEDLRPEFRVRGAWARSIQICGALERALDLALAHVTERRQFGRAIGKFQAVQDLIARSVGLLTTAKAASSHAVAVAAETGFGSEATAIATTVAKIQAGRAAVGVSRNVHQAFGAIGFTLDHQLRHSTTRALSWNRDFGTATEWSIRLGRSVMQSSDSVWEFAVEH